MSAEKAWATSLQEPGHGKGRDIPTTELATLVALGHTVYICCLLKAPCARRAGEVSVGLVRHIGQRRAQLYNEGCAWGLGAGDELPKQGGCGGSVVANKTVFKRSRPGFESGISPACG